MKRFSPMISVLILVGLATAGPVRPANKPETPPSVGVVEPSSGTVVPEIWVPPPEDLFSYSYNVAKRSQGGAAGTVLVIPTIESLESAPNIVETVTKDLNIMCRIFDKELGLATKVGQDKVLSIMLHHLQGSVAELSKQAPTFFGEGSRETKGMYLEGYGAVFLIKVNFQLAAPPQAEEPEKKADESRDLVWKQTEQELYEPEKLEKKEGAVDQAYDESKVEDLKEKLVRTLKHAANVQSLKAGEQVIVTVRGSQAASGPAKVLSIRAKKSDVDAFAKGQLTLDQFRQKVQILMYADYPVIASSEVKMRLGPR